MMYDRLIVERGNVYVADPRAKGSNRFRIAERKEIRIFIEDDLDKARKLASICEVVYLFDQPYNRCDRGGEAIPNNIIRVSSWEEIRRSIRKSF